MARKRDPRRDEAFGIWKQNNGEITNRAIAEQLDIPEKTISAWKSRDKWNAVLQKDECSTANKKSSPKARTSTKKRLTENNNETIELTERQRLFCLYYVKTFNATMSATKAGYSADTAHVQGPRLLGNVRVSAYIKGLKHTLTENLFLDAQDVLAKYIAVAFADINDFLTFGRRQQQVITMYGPLYEKDKDGKIDKSKPVMETVNYVDLKEGAVVDGTIISEVKQGKDGVSIKLADRLKALDKLSLYFDLFPDSFKRKIEEEKLSISKQKLELDKLRIIGDEEEYENDGFIAALNSKTAEVWNDDDENKDS
ncbi:terminase small subunit [Priestia megaterium]|uniref:terminase small subunit n=1 Tax=Priestia megaterium TaxID=1404 RepID=UPI000BF5B60E|nr:terminase small subunit [Priestia megaterium]MCM3152247.1 terminase small subunit [Priestia megaterium]PFW52829.1 terminase [Priestia megaterium]